MKKRILSVLMVAAMTSAVFAGCGSSSTGSTATSTTGSAAGSTAAVGEEIVLQVYGEVQSTTAVEPENEIGTDW